MEYINQYAVKNHQQEMQRIAENERLAKSIRQANANHRQYVIRYVVGQALIQLGESLKPKAIEPIHTTYRRNA